MNQLNGEIARRRTFAIISHPDAGKTTLTEKLLLFGGASAGMLGVMTLGADEPFAGLKEFYDSWESNASIFALVRSRFEHGLLASGISADDAYAGACQNARDVLAFVYLIFLLLWWRHVRDEHAALRCW